MSEVLEDFPAAHSMDTEWYALDEDGHVGRFDTGEDGALPDRAATGLGPCDPNFDLTELEALRLARMLENGDDPAGDWRTPATAGRTLVVMDVRKADRALERIGSCMQPDRFAVINGRMPFVLLSEGELTAEEVSELRKVKGVRWTIDVRDSHELLGECGGDDGLFTFHRDHGEDPGLYTLARAPKKPLKVDRYLPKAASALGRLRLPVRFRAVNRIHLADLLNETEVQTWGDLPLRYTEEYFAKQAKLAASRTVEAQRARQRLAWILLGLLGLLVLAWWLKH